MAEKKKILFIHNSLPEYRIDFWKKLSNYVDLLIFVFEKDDLEKLIYGFEKNTDKLNIIHGETFSDFKKCVNNQIDGIILPPVDNIRLFMFSKRVQYFCKIKKIKYYYWTEKWVFNSPDIPSVKKFKNFIQGFMIRSVCKGSAKCIASGTKSFEFLHSLGISSNRVTIAYDSSYSDNEVENIDFEKQYSIPANNSVILYLGRLIKRKGVLDLIEAFDSINKDNKTLLIAGDGELKQQCIDFVNNNEINNVCFVGKIQPKERAAFYKRACVMVLPSYPYKGVIEAWGLTVNESLQFGTPVIATNCVGAAYDLLDGKSGKMINYNNKRELKEALEQYSSKRSIETEEYCMKKYEEYNTQKMAESFFYAIGF